MVGGYNAGLAQPKRLSAAAALVADSLPLNARLRLVSATIPSPVWMDPDRVDLDLFDADGLPEAWRFLKSHEGK